jgi:hypothetical protein
MDYVYNSMPFLHHLVFKSLISLGLLLSYRASDAGATIECFACDARDQAMCSREAISPAPPGPSSEMRLRQLEADEGEKQILGRADYCDFARA